MVDATPGRQETTETSSLDESIEELKSLIRPGYWGELSVKIGVKNGEVVWSRLVIEKVRR